MSDFDDTAPTNPTTNAEFTALPNQELRDASPRQMFMVHASVEYNDVSLVNLPFMDGITLSGHAISRHE